MLAVITPTLADWGWGHHAWWGGLMMVGWWIVIVVAVVAAVRWLAPGATQRSPDESRARIILEERLARGEIDSTEFRERLSVLEDRR